MGGAMSAFDLTKDAKRRRLDTRKRSFARHLFVRYAPHRRPFGLRTLPPKKAVSSMYCGRERVDLDCPCQLLWTPQRIKFVVFACTDFRILVRKRISVINSAFLGGTAIMSKVTDCRKRLHMTLSALFAVKLGERVGPSARARASCGTTQPSGVCASSKSKAEDGLCRRPAPPMAQSERSNSRMGCSPRAGRTLRYQGSTPW